MSEFFDKIFSLNYWEVMSDLHGFMSMLALVFFGAAIMMLVTINKNPDAVKWLKRLMSWLIVTVAMLESSGMFIYRPYRTKDVPSPRTFLKSSEETKWLHSIIFEHKEHLAYGPLLLLIVGTVLVFTQGEELKRRPKLRKVLLFTLVTALVYLLIVAAEAVLVTKAAPLS